MLKNPPLRFNISPRPAIREKSAKSALRNPIFQEIEPATAACSVTECRKALTPCHIHAKWPTRREQNEKMKK